MDVVALKLDAIGHNDERYLTGLPIGYRLFAVLRCESLRDPFGLYQEGQLSGALNKDVHELQGGSSASGWVLERNVTIDIVSPPNKVGSIFLMTVSVSLILAIVRPPNSRTENP